MMIRAFTAYAVRMLVKEKTVIQTKFIPVNPVSNFSEDLLYKLERMSDISTLKDHLAGEVNQNQRRRMLKAGLLKKTKTNRCVVLFELTEKAQHLLDSPEVNLEDNDYKMADYPFNIHLMIFNNNYHCPVCYQPFPTFRGYRSHIGKYHPVKFQEMRKLELGEMLNKQRLSNLKSKRKPKVNLYQVLDNGRVLCPECNGDFKNNRAVGIHRVRAHGWRRGR